MPKQARRKDAVIVSFLIDVATLAKIDAIVAKSITGSFTPLTRSSYLKRAIKRDLAHAERSRRPRGAKAAAATEEGKP